MKNLLRNLCLMGAAASLAACSVDSQVAKTPTKFWKAPSDALPETYYRPAQIKTEEILENQDEALCAAEKLIAGKKLNLADLIDLALENNTSTRQYWFAAKVYAAQKGKVDSQYFPSISVGAKVYRQKTRQVSPFSYAVGTFWDTGYGASLDINWLLFDFGKRESQSAAAREALRAANFDYNQSLQDLVLNVYVAYFNFYSAIASAEAAQANLADAQSAYEEADARLKNSVGNKQDALRALANAKNAEAALESAKSEIETSRAALAKVLGIEISSAMEISTDIEIPESAEAQKQIDEIIAGALKTRQSVLASYSNYASAQKEALASKLDYLPKIGAQGSFEWGDFTTDRYYGTPSNNYAVAAVLTWNIFDGFTRQYEIISAEAKARAAAQSLKQEQIEVVAGVWAYYYSYKSALKQLESANAAVDASQEAYDATKTAYENGVSTLTDLLNSQALLSQARSQSVGARSLVATSVARLAHAAGSLTANIEEE
ncbi:MAG: TolC family protein [Opitutales bacterium]|nr:TolC family protein [Opitutales bacterium]